MTVRRKSPQEKKETDYVRQRRTHWDSDKAARKAIPASKRRHNKGVRKAANEIVRLAERISVLGNEDLDDVASQKLVSEPTISINPKYGHGVTLRQHISRQQERRTAITGPVPSNSISIQRLERFVDRKYTPELKRALLDYMQRIEHWRTGLGSNIGPSNRLFVEDVSELARTPRQQTDTELLGRGARMEKAVRLWVKKLDKQKT